MGNYLSGVDDISRAHTCPRCRAWMPDEANFCGLCGLQQRPTDGQRDELARQMRAQRESMRRWGGWYAGGLLGLVFGELMNVDERTTEECRRRQLAEQLQQQQQGPRR